MQFAGVDIEMSGGVQAAGYNVGTDNYVHQFCTAEESRHLWMCLDLVTSEHSCSKVGLI